MAVELAVVATELHEREGGGERRRDRRGERGGGAHRGGRALEQGREADAGERREVEVRLLPEAGEDAAEELCGDGEVAKGHHHGDREHRRDERDQPDAARPSPPVPRGHPRAHEREQEARDAEVCARVLPPRGEHVPRGDLRADPHRREAERAVLAAKDVRPEAVPRVGRAPRDERVMRGEDRQAEVRQEPGRAREGEAREDGGAKEVASARRERPEDDGDAREEDGLVVGEAEAEHEGAGDGVAAGARRGVPDGEPEEERDGEVVQREHLRGDGVAPDAGREREEPPGDDAPGGRAGGARDREGQHAGRERVAGGGEEVQPEGEAPRGEVDEERAEEGVEGVARRVDDAARRDGPDELAAVAARHAAVRGEGVGDERDEPDGDGSEPVGRQRAGPSFVGFRGLHRDRPGYPRRAARREPLSRAASRRARRCSAAA